MEVFGQNNQLPEVDESGGKPQAFDNFFFDENIAFLVIFFLKFQLHQKLVYFTC